MSFVLSAYGGEAVLERIASRDGCDTPSFTRWLWFSSMRAYMRKEKNVSYIFRGYREKKRRKRTESVVSSASRDNLGSASARCASSLMCCMALSNPSTNSGSCAFRAATPATSCFVFRGTRESVRRNLRDLKLKSGKVKNDTKKEANRHTPLYRDHP